LRWKTKDHDDIHNIFNKEISVLKKIKNINFFPNLISYDTYFLSILMSYKGQSLYNNFKLPKNWKYQIKNIFDVLTQKHIYYPEFNLNNIVVLNNIISFIDFGLSSELCDKNNDENCKVFIKLLQMINDKYNTINDKHQQHILYNTFINTLKNNKKYPNNIF